jgi:hypothetical protein
MSRSSGAMHVARIPSRYVSKSGEERRYESVLLRRTFRQEGKVRHETLANLSRLPGQVIALVDAALKGATLVDAQDAFETERSVPHGNAAAAHVMASRLGLASLLGPPCREREIAYALIRACAATAQTPPAAPDRDAGHPARLAPAPGQKQMDLPEHHGTPGDLG